MSIATIQKLKREIKKELIDEFIRPILESTRDAEGEYRPEFVKRILKAEKETFKYKFNSKTFLKMLS